jgi:hypothetical protein
MLHALGITHVVSVGECALVAPGAPPSPASFDYGRKGKTGKECGSLWTEEREGRIKVLDIKVDLPRSCVVGDELTARSIYRVFAMMASTAFVLSLVLSCPGLMRAEQVVVKFSSIVGLEFHGVLLSS